MFSFKSTIYLRSSSITKLINQNLFTINKKYFNAPVPAGATGVAPPGTQAPQKTKEQLKIEKLMENWPEYLRNPQTEEMKLLKDTIEYVYKFHQGDKPYLKYHELPEHITRSLNGQVFAMSTENIAALFKDNNGFLTDEMIAKKFYEICMTHKDLTKEFYDDILPEMKKCVANSDRYCNNIVNIFLI